MESETPVGGQNVSDHNGGSWQTRFDERIAGAARAIWHRSAWLDVVASVVAKWTPIAMLLVIAMAASGFGISHVSGNSVASSTTATAAPASSATPATPGVPVVREVARLGAISAVVAAIAARVVNEPISRYFARPRPFEQESFQALVWHEPGQGFPSNHATGAFALAVGMGLVPGYREILYVLAVLLGLSRVYGGLHYLTDVIAGVLHGTLVALVVRWLIFHRV